MRWSRAGWAIAWGCLLFLGCDEKKETRPQQSPAAEKAPSAKDVRSEPPRAALLPEAEIRRLLDAWQKAQNSGSFDDYERLYATRFEGVKRVGAQVESYDRASWIADRKSMFERPFAVQVRNVSMAATETSAMVRFEQTWTSATFQDSGPKQMLLVKEGPELHIAREEMLSSKLGDEQGEGVPDLGSFAFVWDGVLIFHEYSGLAGITGHPRLTGTLQAERQLLVAGLRKAEQKLAGETFLLFGPEGKVCEARVEELFLRVEAQPHFGQVNQWEGRDGATRKATPEERALDLWNLSAMGGRFLAGRIRSAEPCTGAVWARAKSKGEVPVWKKRTATADEKERILNVVRKSKPYLIEQQSFVSSTGLKEPFEEARGGKLRISVFESGDGASYAEVLSANDTGGCGAGFFGFLWFLLQRQGDTFRIVSGSMQDHVRSNFPRDLSGMPVDAAFDLDGDGVPEFAGRHDFFRRVGSDFIAVHNVSPGFFDCPC